MKGYNAFRAAYLGTDQVNLQNFGNFDARKVRYSLLWAMYENTAYDELHKWSKSYKDSYGLYSFIRAIYNPTYRIGEFWKSHLWGGALDANAGDGKTIPSALPILTDNKSLRPAIAQIWQWSNWEIRKDIYSLWGTVFGDGFIKVVDDPDLKKVYLSIVHPSQIADLIADAWGNVKGYVIEYEREDPKENLAKSTEQTKMVTYREVAYRDGKNVRYETYLNNDLYAWNGKEAEWDVPLGFVPLVFMKHNDVGLDFGWSEIHAGLPKFREVDDQASKLNDQIRKVVEGAGIMAGVNKPTPDEQAEMEQEARKLGRDEAPMYWTTNTDAKYIPLVAPLEVDQVAANIQNLLKELERDYPELNSDIHNITGDISGRALRLNRAPIEDKVTQRRPNYDNALVRAHKMALSIGGMRGYDNFKGITLDSFQKGNLDHSIGTRPVFAKDPLDDLEVQSAFWAAAAQAKSAGMPLESFLEENGWTKERITKVTKKIAENRKQLAVEMDFFNNDQNNDNNNQTNNE
ncbi:MAG: hypothetical protein HY865_22115 [Chloroflexi bacterium]|nr:hypothetical protein [Chloroflexota bacterium]